MIIGIDFDDVISNTLDMWVKWLNHTHNLKVKLDDITSWKLSDFFPTLSKAELYEPLNTPEFWDTVSIRPGAQDLIQKLIADGHQVYIITSSHYETLPYKLSRCLFANFPYLTKENIIIAYNKSLIKTDILIDDGEHNLKDFAGIKVIFDMPHNQDCKIADFRVITWDDIDILLNNLITIFN
jgi:5'(3')-deoxyribonucleotidase